MSTSLLNLKRFLIPLIMLPGVMVGVPTATANVEFSDSTRTEFKRAYAKALAGDPHILAQSRKSLKDYPLLPDIEAAWYRSQLGKVSDQTIASFIAANADYSSVGQLRYRWVKSLAKRQKWSMYNDAVETYYADTNDDVLKCLSLRAQLATRPGKSANNAALELWTSGKSLPDQCNSAFNIINQKKLITIKRLRQRIDLALAAGNISLAAYLAKSGHASDVARVKNWTLMRQNPVARLQSSKKFRDNKATREMLLYGLKRAARRDPQVVHDLWPVYRKRYRFTDAQEQSIDRAIALSAARDLLDISLQWLKEVPVHDVESASWYVRRALASKDWPAVNDALSKMPGETKNDTTWRYWQARATEAMGQSEDAKELYRSIAGERSYYGFLAADRLELPYNFDHQRVVPDENVLNQLRSQHNFIRARELFRVDQFGFARSEWDRAVNSLERTQKQQAALLAGQWNWSSRSISTGAKAGARDLMLSHPTPHKSLFDDATYASGIDRTWAYGVARTESLFMQDVKSSANAYGLMQIIPSTGRLTAKSAHINYRGRATLLDPESNIKIGTHYLGQIYNRFGNNQVLATAAYNAGPHRVKSWLPKNTWQADIWVENIPFTETRRYVKKVLAAQAITHWRLTGKEQRLAGMMPPILTQPGTANRFASK